MSARLISRLAGVMAAAGLVLASPLGPALAESEKVVVFAAASLKTALDPIASDFEARSGARVAISYAGSAQLARQIELGAPADIFISASRAWMDYLQSAELVVGDSRTNLLGNRLVLIGHDVPATDAEISRDTRFAEMLGDGRLAIAMVEAVPAGIYGKQALTSLGLWDQVASRLAQTDNVRAALALVAAGEAPYGVVYATDARAEPRVGVVGVFPGASHDAIVYPAAMVTGSRSGTARDLLSELKGAAAREIFETHGFMVIEGAGDG
ncbi:molybdate ABC transporter substrate-binding protein [uncultured Hoeflea sp.]|uniref:molybdate ABC transporter substrate-binding protein n=1 Tax=uncultured Hoeflea sp. TaxID=538666 RepID=UPI002610D7DE|nr:molybdate ABC transporter substrate-binding protein [uncultured Hoeflea sp.]